MNHFLIRPSFWCTLVLSGAVGAALAQAGAPEPSASGPTFRISGFDIAGEVPLDSQETSRILAPFLGPKGTLESLQKAASTLESAIQAKGHALYRVALPAQELGGVVKLSVLKFTIGEVTVQGNSAYSLANVRASLPELREGTTPNFKALAIQTTIANENQGKNVQVSLKESATPDKIDATVQIKESGVLNGSVSLSNTGSSTTGNNRLTVSLGHANLWDSDHQFSAAYTASPDVGTSVKQLGLNYRWPLYQQRAVVGMSYTNSDVVGNFGTFQNSGAGQTYGANYTLYLPPDGGYRSFVTVALDQKVFNASKQNGVVISNQVDRVSRPLTVGYNARHESDSAIWGYGVDLAVNLPGGVGGTLSDYQTEDSRITTDRWSALHANFSVQGMLPKGWMWNGRAQLQYSGDALIAGEQFGLGGSTSVRGTGERILSGDSGWLLGVEYLTPELSPGLRLVGFSDVGRLLNNNVQASTAGKLSADQLASIGVGARYAQGAVSLNAEWARITAGTSQPYAANVDLPNKGSDKLHVNMTMRF